MEEPRESTFGDWRNGGLRRAKRELTMCRKVLRMVCSSEVCIWFKLLPLNKRACDEFAG